MASAYLIYTKAKKKGLTPILGLEAYLRDDSCDILSQFGVNHKEYLKFGQKHLKYMHATMHYMDQAAYEVGCRILSDASWERGHGSEQKPIYTWDNLAELGSYNVTMGSGCLIGVVQRHLLVDRADIAEAYYQKYRALIKPGHFYVEVFPHKCTHNWVEGVFLTIENPDGSTKELKYYSDKKFKTNASEEITAEQLSREFNRVGSKHTHLVAIKNYRTWAPMEAKILAVKYVEDFIENECVDGTTDIQLRANKFMLNLAQKYGDKVIVSDDSHYAEPEDQIVQDVALAQSGNWRFHGSYHRQSGQESYEHFKATLGTSLKEFEGWVDNAKEWSSKFKDFKLEYQPSLANKFYPEDTLAHTYKLIEKHGRMKDDPAWKARLEVELDMLHRNGKIDLLPYFFPAEEVCEQYALNGELTGPGRGSAAGLLLAFLLGITHLDPIKEGLSMERFITLDRILSGKLPDIDQDLPSTDFLVGTEVEVYTVEMEDGTTREFRADELLETDDGLLPVHEVIARKLDVLTDNLTSLT